MMVSWAELPRSPGHAFYDRLQAHLIAAGFDGFVESLCAPLYAARRGRPSLPLGRYFRMLLVGYFEGIDSERELEWRCADSLLSLSVSSDRPAWVQLAHPWFSATEVRVNGQAAEPLTGALNLMVLRVQAGDTRIELLPRPTPARSLALRVSGTALLGTLAVRRRS